MPVPGLCGVYSIEVVGAFYVGGSKNIRARWPWHISHLRHGTHDNASMQAAFDKYGLIAFSFRIIELCDPVDLPTREQFWLDHYHGNLTTFHTSPSAKLVGAWQPGRMKGIPKSAEHKAKIAAAQAAAWKRDDGKRKAALVERNQK